MAYKQIFLGQDGNAILKGMADNFSQHFDWNISLFGGTVLFAQKNKNIPKTIYLKTDFLIEFVNQILPLINDEFILITACSDFCPEVNFKNMNFLGAYKILIKDPRLKYWYMNNMKTKTEKTFSLPAGLAAGKYWDNSSPKEVDDFLLSIRNSVKEEEKIKHKIFACFRPSWFNVCGDEMFIRPQILEIVKKNLNIFDFYEPDSMNFQKFVHTLSRYRYSLCPQGNGMDPNPTAWISLIVKTTPVIYKTVNTIDMFSGTNSVIFFENFEEIADKNLYIEKAPIDFNFLTCEYWANRIKSKIL